jgi:DNA-binding IclR family transcriptional regulator
MYQVSNTNATQKVCRVLKALSNPEPMRLSDIAESADLSKATSLRLLETLIQEGFVQRDKVNKRYMLGDEALLLGMAMQDREHIRNRTRASMIRLAAITGDTIVLSTRHGVESVCVDREFGSYPIRANLLEVGSRRPLGVGAGSMALMAWLPNDEIETILQINKTAIAKRFSTLTPTRLRQEAKLARTRGYALVLDVIVDQMGGVGVPLFGYDGEPIAALSVVALSQRISSRLPILIQALQQEAAELSKIVMHKEAA